MRKSCKECTQKHLSQAIILLSETRQGYPEHYFLAIGHMAEAADEIIAKYPEIAQEIREERLKLSDDRTYIPPLLDIIIKIDTLE